MSINAMRSNGIAVFGPAILLGVLSLVGAFALTLKPPVSGAVAAVFPPWWSQARVMLAAGTVGPLVRFGTVGFVIVVVPEDPGFVQHLSQAGAWLVLNPHAIAGCLSL